MLKANGEIASCYFLKGIGTIEDLKRNGEAFHREAVADYDPIGHPTCSRCDQLLFRNSPVEDDRRNQPYAVSG